MAESATPQTAKRRGLWIYVAIPIIGLGVWLIAVMQDGARPSAQLTDIAPPAEIPASMAHSPTISLLRYLTIGQRDELKGPDAAGYWRLMVSATSNADAPIDVATATCTFFDKAGQPIGNGGASFHNIQPGSISWEAAPIQSAKAPATASCHFDVAYNRE